MRARMVGVISLLVLVLATLPSATSAQPQSAGGEFQVNTYTTDDQSRPAVAVDAAGNFVVVWFSYTQDGSGDGVFGRRYDAAGAPRGSELQVNTYTTNYQTVPAVAMDAAGNFLVVWRSDSQDGSFYGIFGQRYNAAGAALGGEFQVNTYTTESQSRPAVAADPAGSFVVVWSSHTQDGSSEGIFGQRYDAAGVPRGGEFRINSYTTSFQYRPAVAMDEAGNFVVVWASDGQDGSGLGIFGQRYDAAGAALGGEFRANTYTTNGQTFPVVAMDPQGNFVVVWASDAQDGSGYGVFGQRYDAAGAPLGPEFQVNTYTTDNQYRSAPGPRCTLA